MILRDSVDDFHKFFDFVVGQCDLHALTAKHVGRSYQHRITQSVSNFLSLFRSVYGTACCTRNTGLFQDLIKELSVFCRIYILCLGPQDRHSHLHKAFSQLDCRLSTELYHRTIGFFNVDNGFHILRSQRLKIQFVCNIEVCTYSFRIVVDNNGLVTCLGKCPCSMYGTVVELDTLADTDRTGTEYQDLLFALSLDSFTLPTVYGVVIRCRSSKLSCTGINHLVNCCDTVIVTHLLNFILGLAGESGNHIIRELYSLCLFQQFYGQRLVL